MLDDFVNDQPIAYKILINSINRGKLSHAYLFETNNYQNGFDIALAFAKYLLCRNHYSNNSNCIGCNQCSVINNRDYTELKIIESDGLWIKKEQLDSLQREFSKKSFNGGNQIYIINQAEKLNTQAANSILKFLEEPEPNIIAILVTNNKYSLLDTIISRCQIISLKDNHLLTENMSMLDSIAMYLFNNSKDISEFVSNPKSEEIINKTIDFLIYIEKNGMDTLLFTNKLWHSLIKEKEDIVYAFSIMLLFYKEVLNFKTKQNISIFNHDDKFEYVANNNSIRKLCNKINCLLKYKDKVKYNVNTALLIDSLIIEMGNIND